MQVRAAGLTAARFERLSRAGMEMATDIQIFPIGSPPGEGPRTARGQHAVTLAEARVQAGGAFTF
jgi:hypothetical protein